MPWLRHILGVLLAFAVSLSSFAQPLKQGYSNADCTAVYAAFTETKPVGPRVFIKAEGSDLRKLEEISELTVLQYNVENLFNYQGKWGYNNEGEWTMLSPPKTKPERRWIRLAGNIERTNPDIMTWQEVENLQGAEDFVNQKLGGKYRVILIEGNDSRGIDVALLVKKDLPFDVLAQSHREVKEDDQKIFSRDFVVASFMAPGGKASDEPLFKVMNTHNKSQRDSPGDIRSVKKRTQQVERQAEITLSEMKAHPEVPSFILGDMNADVRGAPELEPLRRIGFKDAFDLSSKPVPSDARVTQFYFPQDAPPVYSQLDGMFVSPSGQKLGVVKNVETVPDLDEFGVARLLPKNMRERSLQASDHRAVKMNVDFQKIREAWMQRNSLK